MTGEAFILAALVVVLGSSWLSTWFDTLSAIDMTLTVLGGASVIVVVSLWIWDRYSKWGKDRRKVLETLEEIPESLLSGSPSSVRLGMEANLGVPIYLPDSVRSRHVHILGATGSGKTESVILNLLRQDTQRGLGAIILDAKGDASFLHALRTWVPTEHLCIFDLGDERSMTYDPLLAGSALESAQRLHASLIWSEEYYKSKAFSALQRLFQNHRELYARNPRLKELSTYLEDPETYTAFTSSDTYPRKLAEKDFSELSGLRDQIRTLCIGHLSDTLSPVNSRLQLDKAAQGEVLYFRLQSLLSGQLVGTVGRLVINHLNHLAGTAHRSDKPQSASPIIPTYLDEFASFACPEFADLISKARSANLALHFSHQSVGDLTEVSPAFLNRITDNSATKIVLRINDPDSAEFFARSFGTRLYQKITQRITNVKEIDSAETVGEGTQREAHQFRASPDLFKTLPTGVGSVLIAHGLETPHGASTVLKIKFPKL